MNGAPITPLLTPAERLAVTRERLRQALQVLVAATGSEAGAGWLDKLRELPGAAVVIDALRGWWAQQPWRVTVCLVGDAASTVLKPVAQRQPLALVLGALVFGGLLGSLLMRTGSWRSLLKPALFAGLLPQLVAKTLTQMPVASWVAALASLAQPRPAPAAEAPEAVSVPPAQDLH
ncbi:MAG: hypothetical protein KA387_04090 [Rubrivivax sp.]|nr:hypothetical protein [Rubrivivax sp.]